MLLPALRHRLSRRRPPRESLIARHAAGRSFVDIGCMWSVDGALAFAAEDAGATRVTGVDIMPPTPAYEAEHARRGSSVRFVAGDLHDPATLEQTGVHDVVWCSGVLYHAPHPLLTLERLKAFTGETLIVASETLPLRGTQCVFAPPPGSHPAHSEPFDPAAGYVNWYWGISPGALRQMLVAVGLEPVEEHRTVYHTTIVARPR
ncbi:class I SAM-dependent methyltransferase [Patulibacter defluvii]|uniref:class I SAM-dependent methyltransferase n=1 Tax=Patulibacter defluvii TaxID=3095358 RepID=UPI002A7478C4|nr:class I SAM-dependent methyltransferase [Patulibacter sp. DM4]